MCLECAPSLRATDVALLAPGPGKTSEGAPVIVPTRRAARLQLLSHPPPPPPAPRTPPPPAPTSAMENWPVS